ncbi:hypothetical protein [Desulfovirgula thermocuniculi]|uniref:hypothetical protein n=1 Tax=Desulfovirgula thermocuniculi TaxID=348842 RepID=UPI00042753FC|nr:hypothetical protein [Desulfovirgula thermocuniculi]
MAFLVWLALVLAGVRRLARGPREDLVVILGEGDCEVFLRRLAAQANARSRCTRLVVVVEAPAGGAAPRAAGALGRKYGFDVLLAGECGGEPGKAAGGGQGRSRACTRRVVDARGLAGKELLALADRVFAAEK